MSEKAKNAISATIGKRFPIPGSIGSETITATVSVDLDSLKNKDQREQFQAALLARGLYSLISELKASSEKETQTPEQFKAYMSGLSIARLFDEATQEKTRGRAASDYPQAMRMLDVKTIRAAQKRLIEEHEFLIALPRDVEKLINEKARNSLGSNQRIEWHSKALGYLGLAIDETGKVTNNANPNIKPAPGLTDAEKQAVRRFFRWFAD